MKAAVTHNYGGPEVLVYEQFTDPVAGPGEVLVRVAAAGVNPADLKMRSGASKAFAPIDFPGILGYDVSGTVAALGAGVEGFSVGDQVFGIADHTYAELCLAKPSDLAKIPQGLDVVEAAALPVVTTTGNQLITLGTDIKPGETVLVTGAVGGVGRCAVFTAKSRGAIVFAGVRKAQVAEAEKLGADQVVALDDAAALSKLAPLDAVADTVGGKTAETLIAKVKPGGIFAAVTGAPANAKDFPAVKVAAIYSKPDPKILTFMAQAVKDGRLVIPIGARFPLNEAAKAHAAAEKGGNGKVLLVAN